LCADRVIDIDNIAVAQEASWGGRTMPNEPRPISERILLDSFVGTFGIGGSAGVALESSASAQHQPRYQSAVTIDRPRFVALAATPWWSWKLYLRISAVLKVALWYDCACADGHPGAGFDFVIRGQKLQSCFEHSAHATCHGQAPGWVQTDRFLYLYAVRRRHSSSSQL
jgi:hypothetical protein